MIAGTNKSITGRTWGVTLAGQTALTSGRALVPASVAATVATLSLSPESLQALWLAGYRSENSVPVQLRSFNPSNPSNSDHKCDVIDNLRPIAPGEVSPP